MSEAFSHEHAMGREAAQWEMHVGSFDGPRSQQGRSRVGMVAGCTRVACGLLGALAVSCSCIRSRNLYSKQDVQLGRAPGSS